MILFFKKKQISLKKSSDYLTTMNRSEEPEFDS